MVGFIGRKLRQKKGAAMVEYGMLVAGIALIAAAATSVLGHKTNDLIATIAAVLPGVHAEGNGTMAAGRLIETTDGAAGPIALDQAAIVAAVGQERLGNNLGMTDLDLLIVEPVAAPAP
jgi:Flp pilus assembly pilin Flp